MSYFHSGQHGMRRWGIELTGLAAVDLDTRQALHLEAVQTVGRAPDETLLDYYASLIEMRAETLQRHVGQLVVADAYYSREPFIGRLRAAGFNLVSRLRRNARMRYYYTGPKNERGRPKRYAGEVDLQALDRDVFQREEHLQTPYTEVYSGVVQLKASGCAIRAVIVRTLDARSAAPTPRVYMSTDTTMSAADILAAYTARFQQEFLFRDAKQFAGLEEGQGRSWQKIDYHVNAALTTVNLAKRAHYLSLPAEERGAFSMAAITQAYANERVALRIFSRCGIDANQPKSRAILQEIRTYASRAA